MSRHIWEYLTARGTTFSGGPSQNAPMERSSADQSPGTQNGVEDESEWMPFRALTSSFSNGMFASMFPFGHEASRAYACLMTCDGALEAMLYRVSGPSVASFGSFWSIRSGN